MRLFSLWLFIVLQILFGSKLALAQMVTPPGIQTPRKICSRDLPLEIDAIINRPEYKRSYWGIILQPLDSPTPLYSLNADKNFVPASNVKLLITAAALLKLGPDYRFRTSVYRNNNTITVVGGGDPTLTTAQLQTLAQQLKQQGIKKINHLIIDASYFSDNSPNSSWEWSDLYTAYGTRISSVNLNENTVTLALKPQQLGQPLKLIWSDSLAGKQWKIDNQSLTSEKNSELPVNFTGNFTTNDLKIQGSLTIDSEGESWALSIPNPEQYFLDYLSSILATEKIKIKKSSIIKDFSPQPLGIKIATIESPKSIDIINNINQNSNNLYAEILLKTLGKEANNKEGIEVVKETLKTLEINPESYQLTDGSGLSRQNLISPEVISKTLSQMWSNPVGKIYRESLAKAGISGTLEHRFINTPLVGFLTGKTGTLTGVAALSGYLEAPNTPTLVFSIMVNQSDNNSQDLRKAIDEIMLLVYNYRDCYAVNFDKTS